MSKSYLHNASISSLIIGAIWFGLIMPVLSAEDASSSGLGISGVKFDDRNGDGFLDDGEPALPDGTIRLAGQSIMIHAIIYRTFLLQRHDMSYKHP